MYVTLHGWVRSLAIENNFKNKESWEIQNEIESTSWYATQMVDCSWNEEWFGQLTIVKKNFLKWSNIQHCKEAVHKMMPLLQRMKGIGANCDIVLH